MSLEGIRSLLRERFGLDPQTQGEGTIERAIRSSMERAGFASPDAYEARLRSDPATFDALAERVLVPETWFFRYPRSFELLARLARARPTGSPFRVLCVPCSTGEEPYSAAMTILDTGVEANRLRIVAVDVNAAAIARAREGRYGRNSFREDTSAVLDRHGDWEGETFVVGNAARAVVEWRAGSVLDERVLATGAPYDAVFCRNLLIYLGGEERRRAVDILARCVASTGRLFVGHAETGIIAKSPLGPTGDPAAFATRLPVAQPAQLSPSPPPRPAPRAAPPPSLPAPTRAAEPPPPPTPRVVTSLDEAERAADAGDLARARAACEAHLRAHPASARAHYLLGVVQASLGDDTAARRSLESAVYLDPDHHEALVHLALQAQSAGDEEAARAWRRRAARVIERTTTDGAS